MIQPAKMRRSSFTIHLSPYLFNPFRPCLRDGDQLHLLSQIRQLSLNARVDHRRPGRKNKPPQKLTIFHEGQLQLPMNLRFELGLEAVHHLRIERISAPQLPAKDAALRVVQLRIEPKNLVEISDPSLSKKQTDEVRQNRPRLPLKKPGDQPLFFPRRSGSFVKNGPSRERTKRPLHTGRSDHESPPPDSCLSPPTEGPGRTARQSPRFSFIAFDLI